MATNADLFRFVIFIKNMGLLSLYSEHVCLYGAYNNDYLLSYTTNEQKSEEVFSCTNNPIAYLTQS